MKIISHHENRMKTELKAFLGMLAVLPLLCKYQRRKILSNIPLQLKADFWLMWTRIYTGRLGAPGSMVTAHKAGEILLSSRRLRRASTQSYQRTVHTHGSFHFLSPPHSYSFPTFLLKQIMRNEAVKDQASFWWQGQKGGHWGHGCSAEPVAATGLEWPRRQRGLKLSAVSTLSRQTSAANREENVLEEWCKESAVTY